ncbi:tyrosine-type recombinase/integrase [Furfurilactobacillus rossiae]|uniref:Site-specific recombinase n=1 Tax=Furfurilactobacillus rossiae DSM 15814 TaxID=1114972 RepID=A0A0R1R861_9LACO|nr:tyrosine-type recombinase/integrase [Furfurilactobacillus rossiae]KRL52905.1 site-specific recombinase [Furfurilactobacillus rossiae DSM 15814]QFR65620.1 tyrosine-type recombinase/integrase [Furfurilactobacillus rossiae]QFR68014.1 tyrosine-type recombinase/integrase [Furfurilactobacillus rossiae]QLE61008.1 Tyrosine recombinase XerD [Furfurilactobacillus rossiae]
MCTLIDNFIQDKQHFRNISHKTILAYRSDLTQFMMFQEHHELELTDGMSDFITDLQITQHLMPSTIKRKITTCKMFYQYLLDEQVLNQDPNTGFRRNTKFIVPETLPRVLQIKEVKTILSAAYEDYNRAKTPYRIKTSTRNIAILEVLTATGIRIGELSSLNIDDLNFANRSLLIHGKNRKERLLFLSSPDTYQALKDYLQTRNTFIPHTDALFLNKYGNRLSIFGIENIFLKYRNITNTSSSATPHFLRHTFATELINNGADIREVQELLGHTSITTTTIYAAVSSAQKKKVLRKFNYRNSMHIKTSK